MATPAFPMPTSSPTPSSVASGGLVLPPISRPAPQPTPAPSAPSQAVGNIASLDRAQQPLAVNSLRGNPGVVPEGGEPGVSNPFRLKDGKVMVSKAFIEQNKEQLQAQADKHGFDSAEEYLSAVAEGTMKSGKRVGEVSRQPWSDTAKAKAAAIATEHGMTPDEFLAIIRHESAGTMSPEVTNSIGATGLIQFLPSTAASYLLMEQRAAAIDAASSPEAKKLAEKENPLYWQLSPKDQKAAAEWGQKTMAQLPVERQLDLADLYITDRAKGKKGVDNVYTAIFTGNPDTQSLKEGTAAYQNNKGLDKNKDGVIAREEWTQPVTRQVASLDRAQQAASDDFEAPVAAGTKKKGKSAPPATSAKEAGEFVRRAERVLSLAAPNKSRAEIETIATVVPTKIVSPGTPESKYMSTAGGDGGGAAGLYWPKGAGGVPGLSDSGNPEDIWVSKSVDKPVATGVLAHEMGHAAGLEHEASGLMSTSADQMSGGWSDVIRAAAERGGGELDTEQAARENAVFADVPEFLRGPLGYLSGFTPTKPSQSFSQQTMEETSGPSSIASDAWKK